MSLILFITYVVAAPMPTSLVDIMLLLWEHANLHPFVVEWVNLQKINNCKLNSLTLLSSHDREIKPLRVILRIGIRVKIENIFVLSLSDSCLKVTRFESRVEEDQRIWIRYIEIIFCFDILFGWEFRQFLINSCLMFWTGFQRDIWS